jgi:hypothetical protein
MHVDIEDRRTPPGARRALRGNRGIVEKAEPAGEIAEGMVAGRAAQRIGRAARPPSTRSAAVNAVAPTSRQTPRCAPIGQAVSAWWKPACPTADLG